MPVLYVLAALLGGALAGPVSDTAIDAAPERPHEIRLIQGPIHTDFLLPLTPQTLAAFADLAPHHAALGQSEARWLLIGWGARGFYTTVGSYRDITLDVAWRAVSGDSAVLRVDVTGALPRTLPTRRMMLSGPQYAALL